MTPNILKRNLVTEYMQAYESANPIFPSIAEIVPSTGPSEDYGWLGSLPRVREFRGERIAKRIADYGYTLNNKEFESTIQVPKKDLDDDQTGKYLPLARSIGTDIRTFWDELIFTQLLPGGFTTVAYDGQFFFDVDHVDGASGVQSNKLTTALNAADTSNNFDAAIQLLLSQKDDNGRPMNRNISDLLLIVSPSNYVTANKIVGQRTLAGGAENPNFGKAEVLVSGWLTGNSWYLINRSAMLKPFVVQERAYEPLTTQEGESERGFWNRIYHYGAYLRGNVGYGLWQSAVGSLV